MCECVPAAGSCCGDDVDAVVGDMVAVAQVQAGEGGQVCDDGAEGMVSDVQTRQAQILNVTQFTAAVQLTCTHTHRTQSFTLPLSQRRNK